MSCGFRNIMPGFGHVNTYGQNQNCYFCTVAALNNWTTDQLVGRAQTMMQDTAQVSEIHRLFKDAGDDNVTSREFINFQDVERWVCRNVECGEAVGLAYSRIDGTGHMIVVQKTIFGSLQCIDYQAAWGDQQRFPPNPPELNLVRFIVFHHFLSMDALAESFSKLRIGRR